MTCLNCKSGESLIQDTINRLVEEKAQLRGELARLQNAVTNASGELRGLYRESVNRMNAYQRNQLAHG